MIRGDVQFSQRQQFTDRTGLIFVALGSAIGLGNIMRFPYLMSKHGGGAFLIIYILSMIILGIPLMASEFILGRQSGQGAIGSFKELSPDKPWYLVGGLGIISSFILLGLYSVLIAWSLKYLGSGLINSFAGKSPSEINQVITGFTSKPIKPFLLQIIPMIVAAVIVVQGLREGIESAFKPIIVVIFLSLAFLVFKAFKIPGGGEAMKLLFKPNFSNLSIEGILAAISQAIFSLSLGTGVMITLGSYMPARFNILKDSISIVVIDIILAIFSAITVFPIAHASGAAMDGELGFTFLSVPAMLEGMENGYSFIAVFYLLVLLALFTGIVILLETLVAAISDRFDIPEKNAVLYGTIGATVLGIILFIIGRPVTAESLLGENIFNSIHNIIINILLPLSALGTSIYVGWFMDEEYIRRQLSNNRMMELDRLIPIFNVFLRFIVPIGIVLSIISRLFL